MCVFYLSFVAVVGHALCVTDKNNDLSVSFGFTQSYLLKTHTVCSPFIPYHFFVVLVFACVCVVKVFFRVCVQSDSAKIANINVKNDTHETKRRVEQRKLKTKKKATQLFVISLSISFAIVIFFPQTHLCPIFSAFRFLMILFSRVCKSVFLFNSLGKKGH